MKTILLVITLVSFGAFGQLTDSKSRTIEVKGSSEIEVTPDEIFVAITLKEYKKGSNKVSLDQLEAGLVKSLRKLDIEEDKLRVQNVYGYNWNWRKKRSDDFLGTKTFVLEVSDLKKMNDLVEMLDPEGLNNMNVQSYSHSEIEKLRKEVKIGAMMAAKEKATYLLESVDEQLGKIMEVQEVDYGYQSPMMHSNMALRESSFIANDYESDIDFKKIKLRAEMRVVFEIGE